MEHSAQARVSGTFGMLLKLSVISGLLNLSGPVLGLDSCDQER